MILVEKENITNAVDRSQIETPKVDTRHCKIVYR